MFNVGLYKLFRAVRRLRLRRAMLPADTILQLRELLQTPDGADLQGRGHRITYPGHPHRRHLTLKPLLLRWMVRRHLRVDPSESAVLTATIAIWPKAQRRA